jgi:Uma2 family endonuclease
MAAASSAVASPVVTVDQDQRIVLYDVSWSDYVRLNDTLGRPGLRMTYCEGALELMSPSFEHEAWKTMAARLVELHAFLRKLPLNGYGSTTFRSKAKKRGAEPDECWTVGRIAKKGDMPDVVLEVIRSSPLLDKLSVYDGLRVPEVWIFRDGGFEVHRRRAAGGYDRLERSTFLPQLDLDLLARFVMRDDQDAALREFAAAIEG